MKCDCDTTNTEISTKDTEKFSAKSMYQSFYKILKYSNYKVLKCRKLTFNFNNLKNNLGSIIIIASFIIYSIFFIVYYIKGIIQLKDDFNFSLNIPKDLENKAPIKKKKSKDINDTKMNKENKNKKRDNPDIMNSEEKLDNKNQLKELRLEKKEKKNKGIKA